MDATGASNTGSKDTATNVVLATTTLVISVLSTAYVTYKLTKYQSEKQYSLIVSRQYEREQLLKQKAIEARKNASNESDTGTLLPDVTINKVYLWECEDLRKLFPSSLTVNVMKFPSNTVLGTIRSPLLRTMGSSHYNSSISNSNNNIAAAASTTTSSTSSSRICSYNKLITDHECIIADIVRKPNSTKTYSVSYMRAGPRKLLHFDPATVNAAIVTCGGLCPGLNNVIREITNTLHQIYGIGGVVYGIQGGFRGFYDTTIHLQPIILTPALVENIHHEGGTVLGSSRGGFDLEKILNFLDAQKINQLYVIGGDGTHRGAFAIHEGCMKRGYNISVAGIPKTIDNDVDYIDHSFGFGSAVEAATLSIRSAKTEAVCNLPNGIGIVKLMGRSAGFIAAHATMASSDVDLCLVPEVPIVLEGETGCLPHLLRRVQEQGYAVVVVAEGAGEDLLGSNAETDASGNKILPKIGEYMKDVITKYFETHTGQPATVKYIDPSYTVRSVPANASDSLYCMQLGQNVVHGAMAGITGFTVGLCNNRMVWLPIPEVVATSPRSMNPYGRTWERVLALTRQPNTVPPKDQSNTKQYDSHAPMLR